MSLEAIKKISAIEVASEKQRADALQEAKRIIAGAEVAGREMVQEAQSKAEAEVHKLCLAAEERGQAAAAEIAQQKQQECAALEQVAAKKMAAAVSIIVGRVVNG
jgi:V/A-type H+-transporting ATPase subunit G/H